MLLDALDPLPAFFCTFCLKVEYFITTSDRDLELIWSSGLIPVRRDSALIQVEVDHSIAVLFVFAFEFPIFQHPVLYFDVLLSVAFDHAGFLLLEEALFLFSDALNSSSV